MTAYVAYNAFKEVVECKRAEGSAWAQCGFELNGRRDELLLTVRVRPC